MNLSNIEFPVVPLMEVRALRSQHLRALRFGQDALVEAMTGGCEARQLIWKDTLVGYVLITESGHSLEYWVTEEYIPYAHLAYRRLVKEHGLQGAIVQSFDDLYLSCALDINTSVKVMGDLTRGYLARTLPQIPRIHYQMRRASVADLSRILAVKQEVFTHAERMSGAIDRAEVHVFEREDKLIGFGMIRRVVEERSEAEIGLAVDVPYRNRGYAIYFLRDLAEQALADNLVPMSGCAVDNEASVRMGLRIGLQAHHRLLRISFTA